MLNKILQLYMWSFCNTINIICTQHATGHNSSMAFMFYIEYEITVFLRGQPVRN